MMDTKHFFRNTARGLGGWILSAAVSASALSNVAPGTTLWLQGYDLNPQSAAFRNEGLIKLECIDDALPIALSVADPGLHNAEGGVLQFSAGAGGLRSYAGDLLNEGEVRVAYGTVFGGAGSRIENKSTFAIGASAVVWAQGPAIEFAQESGVLRVGGGFEVRDGTFLFDGGVIEGQPCLVRTRVAVAGAIVDPYTFELAGDGSRFEGRLRGGQTLRINARPDHGPSRAVVAGESPVEGRIVLTATLPGGTSVLDAGAGLEIAPEGQVDADSGAGGLREIRGAFALRGRLNVEAPLRLVDARPFSNRGHVSVGPAGSLDVPAGLRQVSGRTELRGGRIASSEGIAFEGGELSGTGILSGTVSNAARIEVAASRGTLRVGGEFRQAAEGRLVLRLGKSADAPDQPLLEVWGNAQLGGAMEVTLEAGVTPETGDDFVLVLADRLEGGLDHLSLPALTGDVHWELESAGGRLVASVKAGQAQPALKLDAVASGAPRLRLTQGAPFATGVEYSTDLAHWLPLPARIEFVDDAVVIGGLPKALEIGPAFFRPREMQ